MSPAEALARSEPTRRLRIRPPVRPWRVLVGGGLVVGGALGCWALIVDASERHEVLVLRRSVPAGEAIAVHDLGVVAVGSDDGVPSVAADRLDEVVGRYARYQLVGGALLVDDNLQDRPLVAPGRALMSVVVEAGDIPRDIGAGDAVVLVLVASGRCDARQAVSVVDATVVSEPVGSAAASSSGSRAMAVSVEVDGSDVATVAVAERVSIARPNSAEAAGAIEASGVECTPDPAPDAGDPTGAAGNGSVDGGGQQPVPTGVVPLDPSDVLIDPSSSVTR